MSMTLEELADHADNVRGLLEDKKHQARDRILDPAVRALVLYQIAVLENRLDELDQECARLRDLASSRRDGAAL